MLEDGIEEAVVVDLELGWGILVESVGHSQSGLNSLLVPVEDEFSANNLGESGGVVDEEVESAELEHLLVGGDVLNTNESIGCWAPWETEVVLLEVAYWGVEDEVGTKSEVLASEVGEVGLTKEGSNVEEGLNSCIRAGVLKANLEIRNAGCGDSPGSAIGNKLEAFNIGKSLLNKHDVTLAIYTYLKWSLELIGGRAVLLDSSLVSGLAGDTLELSIKSNLAVSSGIRSALFVGAADLL